MLKFKVGDKVKWKNSNKVWEILKVYETSMVYPYLVIDSDGDADRFADSSTLELVESESTDEAELKLKVGDKVRSTGNHDIVGEVTKIDRNLAEPYTIEWSNDTLYHYTLDEFKYFGFYIDSTKEVDDSKEVDAQATESKAEGAPIPVRIKEIDSGFQPFTLEIDVRSEQDFDDLYDLFSQLGYRLCYDIADLLEMRLKK